MTPGRLINSPMKASAGGHDEQPWLVNSSTTTGADSAASAGTEPATAVTAPAPADARSVRRLMRKEVSIPAICRKPPSPASQIQVTRR